MKNISKRILHIAGDLIAIDFCLIFALLLSVNFDISNFKQLYFGIPIVAYILMINIPYLIFSAISKSYHVMWIFAGTLDFAKLGIVSACTSVTFAIVAEIFDSVVAAPEITAYITFMLLFTLVFCTSRAIARMVMRAYKYNYSTETGLSLSKAKPERVMLIGAGNAASLLIGDMYKNEAFKKSEIVCCIDDDESKIGQYINGVKIVGTRDDIVSCAKRFEIDLIVFAMPSVDKNERAEILKICSKTGCKLKSMPSMDEVLAGDKKIRNVKIEDLLERAPINMDIEKLIGYIENKTILVTGGGGSIGSELCRQIAAHKPKKLIIFDVYENNAYDILNELRDKYPDLDVLALIGSVRDTKRINGVFEKYRPEIVYHAAAHKHVPLMEDSPNEAIKNNVFGTLKCAEAASKYGTKRFVLISTDKAVNPTNVMGATKRICEMVVQSMQRNSNTEFVAVRFGNVLGSNGSVIPLFKKQIEAGGPVQVTHPDIIRYFMTIPEAVSLVLTAGAMAKGGEIFVLDMGKPVKIVDLAKNMIRLMGYEVDKDIKIEFIGLRPGEKLFEEMLMDEEGLRETENHLIHIGNPLIFDDEWFMSKLDQLKIEMYDDNCDIRSLIHEIVPTYKMPKKIEESFPVTVE